MECWEKHEGPRDTRLHSMQGVAAIHVLSLHMLSPTPPPDEGGMGWSLRRSNPLCPYAFSGQLSLRSEYKIPNDNKPSKRDGKDIKKNKQEGVVEKLRSTTADSLP